MPSREQIHPEDDPRSPFYKELWADQDKKYPATDADVIFGELMNAQDEMDRDGVNIAGLARHQSGPNNGNPIHEPSRLELPNVIAEEPVKADNLVKRYFYRLFQKHL